MMLSKFLQSSNSIEPYIPTAQPVEGGFGAFGALDGFFGQSEFSAWAGVFDFFASLWSVYTILAYIVTIIFLVMYVYSSVRRNLYMNLQTETLRDQEKLYDEQFRGAARNSRLQDVLAHSASDNPNDWRLAIIEADIILDTLLKERGYAGNALGERLKSISSSQLSSLNDAWEAHKVRNRIAHDGSDFILTKRLAQETIARYQIVFNELGVT